MGITGLLPFLKKASKNTHARNFSGYTAAVDGHGWLHKGAFGCAVKLGMGEATDAYVQYFMKYVNTLLENGIRPLIVFDGRHTPAKEVTNEKRRKVRAEARQKAQTLVRQGNKKDAWEYFVKSIHVTHEMVHAVIEVLRQKHIDYIVSPYEADPQLAYLALKGYVDLVVTEDSDLVLFGCPKILFKLKITGDCVLFDSTKIHLCMGVPSVKFEFDRFRQMCILSGCDYLESLPGIGLTRAKKIVTEMTTQDIAKAIKAIPSTLKLDVPVTDEYIRGFFEAELSFLYHMVYDPILRKVVPLTPYNELSPKPEEMAFCGANDLSETAWFGLAIGSIHTKTMKRVDNYDVDKDKGYANKDTSIWSKKWIKANVKSPGRDLLKETKHSSTKGLQVNVSIKTAEKKRPIVSGDHKPRSEDVSDKELLAIYAGGANKANQDSENENVRRSKRVKRGSLISTDSYSLRGGRNDFEEEDIDSREGNFENKESSPVFDRRESRKRKSNPFLKSPDLGLRARAKVKGGIHLTQDHSESFEDEVAACKTEQDDFRYGLSDEPYPVCLVQKNRIYDDDKNIIVKSRYFRSMKSESLGSEHQDISEKSSITSQQNAESQLSIYSVDKDNFDGLETQNVDDLLAEDLPTEVNEGCAEVINQPSAGDENTEDSEEIKSADVINLDDDSEEERSCTTSSYFNVTVTKTSNNNPVSKKSPRYPSTSDNKCTTKGTSKSQSAGKLTAKCRVQGLKRGKPDPSQRTLFVFGYQPKAKM